MRERERRAIKAYIIMSAVSVVRYDVIDQFIIIIIV